MHLMICSTVDYFVPQILSHDQSNIRNDYLCFDPIYV